MLKRIISIILAVSALNFAFPACVYAENADNTVNTENTEAAQSAPLTVNAKAAVIMEQTTGRVIFEQNADEALPPASVTKIMTLLIIYDSVKSGKIKWEDKVTVSEHAASMGGSQIFLEPNETQSVKDLTKAIAVASANDAAVAMAEFIGGSEEGFVKLMNEKAKALGMNNTTFQNACGLDTDNHLMSARDIAIMSRELMLNYPEVQEYTTTWQDTITHTTKKGTTEFGLTNTNKLIKWYNGATGLKTGSTGKALYCLSGTAERDGLNLIAVVMAAPDPKVRFQEVMKMLDYGFANYGVEKGEPKGKVLGQVQVLKGKESSVNAVVAEDISVLKKKGDNKGITYKIELTSGLKAPLEAGTKAGEIIYYYDGEEAARADLVTDKAVEKASLNDTVSKLLQSWLL